MAGVLIKTDGTTRTITPEADDGDGKFTLFEFACLISILKVNFIPLKENFVLVVNPDGWDLAMNFNKPASDMLAECYGYPELVYGDVIVVPSDEIAYDRLM